MKIRLTSSILGRAAGTVADVRVQGPVNHLVEDAGGQFYAPANICEEVTDGAAPEPAPVRPPEPLVARFAVAEEVEQEARTMYDDYSAAVGGVAFNGDPLPGSAEFFEDPLKQKQANAYRVMAGLAIDRIHAAIHEAIDAAQSEEEEEEIPESFSKALEEVKATEDNDLPDEKSGIDESPDSEDKDDDAGL